MPAAEILIDLPPPNLAKDSLGLTLALASPPKKARSDIIMWSTTVDATTLLSYYLVLK